MKSTILLSILAIGLASCGKQEPATAGPSSDESQVQPYPLEVCLVSGEKLGSMGEPPVIIYEGREIKFCCDRCEPKFREDPDKYLSQLDQP